MPPKTKTILVTGSSGLIGSEVVGYFCREGGTVHGVDSNMRAECLGIALHNASFCSSITNTNDRLFCQGIATHSQTPCTSIQ